MIQMTVTQYSCGCVFTDGGYPFGDSLIYCAQQNCRRGQAEGIRRRPALVTPAKQARLERFLDEVAG